MKENQNSRQKNGTAYRNQNSENFPLIAENQDTSIHLGGGMISKF